MFGWKEAFHEMQDETNPFPVTFMLLQGILSPPFPLVLLLRYNTHTGNGLSWIHHNANVKLNHDWEVEQTSPGRSPTTPLLVPSHAPFSNLAATVDFEHCGWMLPVSVLHMNWNSGVFASGFCSALFVINLVLKNKTKTLVLSREQFRLREFVF